MVELTAEELKLDYVKYFKAEMAPVSEEKIKIGEGDYMPQDQMLAFEDRNKFIAGTDGLRDTGFGVAVNGTGYVACKSFYPGVTSAMLDWWFAWHPIDCDLRYKLWHPYCHFSAKADKPEYIKDKSVPMNQKTWGTTHTILEDVGGGKEKIIIHFMRPADAGIDESLIGTEKCQSLVIGVGEGNPAYMVHKWYDVEGGVIVEDRFWMGYGWMGEGKFGKCIPDGMSVPGEAARGIFTHGCAEFANLASFLPQLYAEHKDDL